MLSAYISPADIKVGLESTDREECFAELIELLVAKNPKINRLEAMQKMLEREEKGSTAVLSCVAIPHGVLKFIGKTAIAIGISRNGIEFEAPLANSFEDAKKPVVNVIFAIMFEERETETHIRVLKDILQLVSNPDFVKNILQSKTSREVYDLIQSLES